MPNWCKNRILISGKKSNIEKFYQDVLKEDSDGDQFSFFELLPFDGVDSVELQRKEWGCKWGPSEARISDIQGFKGNMQFEIDFETPWSSPMEGLKKLSKKYKVTIEGSYSEPFCRHMRYKYVDGEEVYKIQEAFCESSGWEEI